MSNVKIQLDLGDGLHTSQDKVGVYNEPNGNMYVETNSGEEGVYVEDLNGADGTGGSSTYDGWSTLPGTGWSISTPGQTTNDFIDMNRLAISLIFSFGWQRPQMRHSTSIAYSSTVKDVTSICNEIDAPIYYNGQNKTAYRPQVGELIQLITNPVPWVVPVSTSVSASGTIAVESLNRMNTDSDATAQEVKAMFVIKSITYNSDTQQGGNEFWVNAMTLICIYSNITNFTVGQEYSGSPDFTSSGRV